MMRGQTTVTTLSLAQRLAFLLRRAVASGTVTRDDLETMAALATGLQVRLDIQARSDDAESWLRRQLDALGGQGE